MTGRSASASISRRSLLTTAAAASAAAAVSSLTPDAASAAVVSAPPAALIAPYAVPPAGANLDLTLWDRPTIPLGPDGATLRVTGGTLPKGLGIAGRYLTGKLTEQGRYSFEVRITAGGNTTLRSFSGEVGAVKQDMTLSVSLDSTTPMTTYRKQLDKIKEIGGNVTVVILSYIPDETAATFTRVSAARVRELFTQIEDRGLRVVMLKPHIVTRAAGDDFYRGDYRPASTPEFFTNWRKELEYFASLCRTHEIEYLSLTSEQRWQTEAEHYGEWVPIVRALRRANRALKLTAAFTTLELYMLWRYWVPLNTPHLARLLDVFGINSWVRLTNKIYTPGTPNISVDELAAGWNGGGGLRDAHLDKLTMVCTALKMPFFITEVGVVPRVDGLSVQENAGTAKGAVNHEVQALLFRSLMRAPMLSPLCTGAAIWHMQSPFHIGDVNRKGLYPGEAVLAEEIRMQPRLVTRYRSPQTEPAR